MFLESVLNGNGVTKVSAIYNIYSENKLGIFMCEKIQIFDIKEN